MRAFVLLVTSTFGCLPAPPEIESEGPRVVEVRADGDYARGVSRWSPLDLVLRGRLSDDSLQQIAVIPMVPTTACVTSKECAEGACDGGRCWTSATSSSELRHLDDGDFAGGWPVVIDEEGASEDGASTVRLTPDVAWRNGWRYRMWMGADVRSPEGAPLDPNLGVGHAIAGRWSWEFFVEQAPARPRLLWPRVPGGGELLDVPNDLTHVEVAGASLHTPSGLSLATADDGAGGERIGLVRAGACSHSDAPDCARYRLDGALIPERGYALVHHRGAPGHDSGAWEVTFEPSLRARTRAFQPENGLVSWSADARCLYVGSTETSPGILRVATISDSTASLVPRVVYAGPSAGSSGGESTWGIQIVAGLHDAVSMEGAGTETGPAVDTHGTYSMVWRYTSAWTTTYGRAEVVAKWLTAPRPAIRITEVLADPLGPEPRQEYVELQVMEAAAWDSNELWIVDRPWVEVQASLDAPDATPIGDPLPATIATAGEILLVVPEDFVADAEDDGIVSPNTQLLRVHGSLGVNGLLNAGEAVTIYRSSPPQRIASFGARGGADGPGSGTSVVRVDLGSWCDGPADWGPGEDEAPTPGSLP